MDIQDKIEIYSAMPYEGGDNDSIDDWFHVAYNEAGDHIEAVWDIGMIFRPECDDEIPLVGLEEYFEEIRLHYALNYLAQRYHEDLLIWCMKSLKPDGKLQIVSPDFDYIIRRCIADGLGAKDYGYSSKYEDKINGLEQQIENLKRQLDSPKLLTFAKRIPVINRMVKKVGIPEDTFKPVSHEEMLRDTDGISKEFTEEWDFDIWVMQKLYSSGAGMPQDTFKSMFNKRYISILLRRCRFIIDGIQNNSSDDKIEVKAHKHRSRLL